MVYPDTLSNNILCIELVYMKASLLNLHALKMLKTNYVPVLVCEMSLGLFVHFPLIERNCP